MLLSCEEIINEQDISNTTITTLAPTNNVILKPNEQINYNWQLINGATNYQLQIATPTFTSAAQIKLDTLVTNNTFTIDSLKVGNYQWRVKAVNSVYETPHTTTNFKVEK